MTIRLKIFLLILILLNIFLIIKRLKSKKISIRYVVFWIFLLILLSLSVCFDNLYYYISDFFGFEKTSNMVFLLGFFFLFYLNFLLVTTISSLTDKVKTLTQEISLLKERVNKYEKED